MTYYSIRNSKMKGRHESPFMTFVSLDNVSFSQYVFDDLDIHFLCFQLFICAINKHESFSQVLSITLSSTHSIITKIHGSIMYSPHIIRLLVLEYYEKIIKAFYTFQTFNRNNNRKFKSINMSPIIRTDNTKLQFFILL